MFKFIWYKMCERCAPPYHLLLDTGSLSTAKVKMKKLHLLTRLLIIGLLAQCGLAKPKSRNGRTQRQAYLPPLSSSGPRIREEYITIHEDNTNGQARFQGQNYGNEKYQIYEIHNHYEPSTAHKQPIFNAPQYLPPQHGISVQHQGANIEGNAFEHVVHVPEAPAVPVSFDSHFKHDFQVTQSDAPYTAPIHEEVIRVQHIHVTHPQAAAPQTADLPEISSNQEQYHGNQQQIEKQQFKGPDYLPPHHEQHNDHQEARVFVQQNVNYQQGIHTNQFSGHDDFPSLQQRNAYKGPDYLPPHQEHPNHNVEQQVQQVPSFRGPRVYLPPQQEVHNQEHHTQSNPSSYTAPGYLPPHKEQQVQSQQTSTAPEYLPPYQEQQVQQQQSYAAPSYLPPYQEKHGQQQIPHQQSYTAPDSLPPHQEQPVQQVQSQQTYTAPDYLPPHQEQQTQHVQQVQHQQSYTAPDYLPPHQEKHGQQNQQTYTAPDYLPPHQDKQVQQQQSYTAQEYLPPHQEQHVQEVQHQQSYTAPDYLPPHQEQHIQQQVQPQHPYTSPNYLPPHQERHSQQQVQPQQPYTSPNYLPPHQEQHTHEEIHQEAHAPQSVALPVGYEPKIPAVPSLTQNLLQQPTFQHSIPQPSPQHQPAALILPEGYDFEKPANAEEAIAELHTLPAENSDQQEVSIQTQVQVSQDPQQADIIYGSQKPEVNYHANGYLPPQQSQNNKVIQSHVQTLTSSFSTSQQNSPQKFTPTQAAAVHNPISNYLPPTTPVQYPKYNSNLHSLSSYMSTVEPFQRYASTTRQPFRVYGPPSSASNTGAFTQQQPAVAQMYHEQASRTPYYAPAMSYATNAVANSYTLHHPTSQHHGFNQQTRNNLQRLMPAGYSSSNYAAPISTPFPSRISGPQTAAIHTKSAVPDRQSISTKLRTVQILNPTAVKTLKLLETADQAGVKTIKILGSSNTSPTGEHRIIKVVTQNSANSHGQIQTLKIFNDHVELPNNGGGTSNAYLPPNARVVRQSPLKLQMVSNQKYRQVFTGSHRHRLRR